MWKMVPVSEWREFLFKKFLCFVALLLCFTAGDNRFFIRREHGVFFFFSNLPQWNISIAINWIKDIHPIIPKDHVILKVDVNCFQCSWDIWESSPEAAEVFNPINGIGK